MAALRGLGVVAGTRDDEGFPELRWYGVKVASLTAGNIIRAVWAKIDGDNLPPWEQSLLVKQMAAILAEPRPSSARRLDAQEVIRANRSFTDE